jgi:hypothetical protein
MPTTTYTDALNTATEALGYVLENDTEYLDPGTVGRYQDAYDRLSGNDPATAPLGQGYATGMITDLLERGPIPGTGFFHMQAIGNGKTHWFNVTPEKLAMVARILEEQS